MGKCLQEYFAVNPLEDPVVKSTLAQVQMSGQQLIEMSVRELNKRLAGCSSYVVARLKKCRRTLKNRGYAKSCRIKRIAAKSELEQVNAKLLTELRELRKRNQLLSGQLNELLTQTTGGQQQQQPQQVAQEQPIGRSLEVVSNYYYHHHTSSLHQMKGETHHRGPLFQRGDQPSSYEPRKQQHGQQQQQQQHHHQQHDFRFQESSHVPALSDNGSSMSTCNSSPASSLSICASGYDAAYHSLDLEFAFENELDGNNNNQIARPHGNVQAMYNEEPHTWSATVSSPANQQQVIDFP